MSQHSRTQKARNALRGAMIELLTKQPYESISVQDIASRAGVSRSSFYVYFRDKDDLLISGFEEIGVNSYDDLFETSDSDPYYPNFSIVLFRGSEREKEVSRAILKLGSSNPAFLHMRNMLVIKTRDWLHSINTAVPEEDLEPTVHYLASALQGLLTWWVTNDFPSPADTISRHFNQLAIAGLQGLLHLAPENRLQ
ncbi:MAG: TetR/AcrR family transcriptional regulator [Porticoccaceae bacterium]|jgi:AcrR family transcriptional regulator